MRFLVAAGGDVGNSYGVMTSPAMKGVARGIKQGLPWAMDNEAFSRDFDPLRYFSFLEKLKNYKSTCLFLTVPDVVGDASKTLASWARWRGGFDGWPVAFVAQDGQENQALPDDYDTLFIGGSTEWKLSGAAVGLICKAQSQGKRIHIGRVNWRTRYNAFRVLRGSDHFTCDGTRQRYQGLKNTIRCWSGYEAQRVLVTI